MVRVARVAVLVLVGLVAALGAERGVGMSVEPENGVPARPSDRLVRGLLSHLDGVAEGHGVVGGRCS